MAKYGDKSQKKVQTIMDEMKAGKLKIGRSNKKVKDPKQAIAIALSEARKEVAKVPAPSKKAAKKGVPKKAAKKAAPKAKSGKKVKAASKK